MKNKEEKPQDVATSTDGMIELMLNILESPKMSKEDKTLARDEIKRRIHAAEQATAA